MFAGTAISAIVLLLVVFLIIYPLTKKIVPNNTIWITGVIVGAIILVCGGALILTAATHLIFMGIFLICFGALTLLAMYKLRAYKTNPK